MQIGVGLNVSRPVADVVEEARRRAEAGFGFVTSSHIFTYDAITLLGVVGSAVPDVDVMTAVVPIYTRHPLTTAQGALTVQSATGGRFVLGIGLSHKMVIENFYGLSFERPLQAMREYLACLMPLVRRESASVKGEMFSVSSGPIDIDATPPPVIVAALGPAMLELAGRVADGTATWMTGRRTLTDHIVPAITRAAEQEGRPAPRVYAALPVCVTNDAEAAKQKANEIFAIYGQLPSYRAMLDREGAATPADAALIGSEEEVRGALQQIAGAGVTHFAGETFGDRDQRARTTEVLLGLASGG